MSAEFWWAYSSLDVFHDTIANRLLKNKNQVVRQGARRFDKRSIFKHM